MKCAETYKQQREYIRPQVDYKVALFEIKSENFVEAIRKFNKMLSYINDLEYYVKVKAQLAKCYYLLADKEHGEQREIYLDEALSEYKDLLSIDNELTEEQRLEIQSGFVDMYYCFDDEIYRNDFEEIVNIIESKLEGDDFFSSDICDIYVVLGRFYYIRFVRENNYEDLEKAKEYYTNISDYEIDLETEDRNKRKLFLADKVQAARFFVDYADEMFQSSDEEYSNLLFKAVSIFEDVSSLCSYDKFPQVYFQDMQGLAHCYMLLYDYENAYACFKKFIYMDDETLDRWLYRTFKFMRLNLNKEDEAIILRRYQRVIEYYEKKSNIKKVYQGKLELMICYYCLYEKQNDNEYYDKGKELSDELYAKYYGYFDNELDRILDESNKLYD